MRKFGGVVLRLLSGLGKLWLILGVTLVLAAVFEGSLRIVRNTRRASQRAAIAAQSGFRGAKWAPDYVDELLLTAKIRWQPYVHTRSERHHGRFITIGEDGFRVTPQPSAPEASSNAAQTTPHKAAIWMLGGSVTWGWGSRDEHTIPAELARDLTADGFPVEVSNLAQIGYVSTQEVLTLFTELRTGRRPDIVVSLSGYNDVMAALQEGVAGLPQNEHNRRAEFNSRLLGGAALAIRDSGTFWLARGLLKRAGLGKVDARETYGGADQPSIDQLADDVVRVYADNVRLIEQLRQVYGFQALYYWQPSVFWKKNPTPDEAAFAASFAPMKALQAKVRERLTTSPVLSEVPFRDLTGLFDDTQEPVFIDTAHFSEDANRVVAREIAGDLEPLLDARNSAVATGAR